MEVIYIFYSLINIDKIISKDVALICSPTSNVWGCLFPFLIVNRSCNTFFKFLPVWMEKIYNFSLIFHLIYYKWGYMSFHKFKTDFFFPFICTFHVTLPIFKQALSCWDLAFRKFYIWIKLTFWSYMNIWLLTLFLVFFSPITL